MGRWVWRELTERALLLEVHCHELHHPDAPAFDLALDKGEESSEWLDRMAV